ncbi:UDP-N-acetylmuramoyl-L-alanine--D-glutamate ligase [Glacieibacterium sp.]|uniref:UDP-N-acetylmuramoyl-L-alanine--D-glutamate ligase n=1 Tax=Glacieibacterium sp. TaxID=2860237 RepID=UPI003B008527
MITARTFAGKTYGIYGLARSGRSTAASLIASGATVLAWDDGEAARAAYDGPLTDLHAADLSKLDALVVSPGVPHEAPLFQKALAADIPVIGDIELFALARPELPAHRVVGITGTNGKSTTTALIHHILETAGVPTRMGGNIGLPILSQAPLPAGGVYVLELSSFQIDLTYSLDCDVAVLLNITPDHLDRHGNFAAYAAAKGRLFEMQSPSHHAVFASDDHPSAEISRNAPGIHVWFDAEDFGDQRKWPNLQGPHNIQNAVAASAAARALGIAPADIERGFQTYAGLPHRMERVAEVDGVLYVNDSKATNPTSTAPALAAYPHIHWIAGGLAKTDELDACLPHLGHVRVAYLIGAAAPLFGRLLDGKVPVVQAGTLERAIALAAAAAGPGDTVMLSPACASYDQFKDYEARGAAFRAVVEALKSEPLRDGAGGE